MKFKHMIMISLLLIAFLIIPVSFATDNQDMVITTDSNIAIGNSNADIYFVDSNEDVDLYLGVADKDVSDNISGDNSLELLDDSEDGDNLCDDEYGSNLSEGEYGNGLSVSEGESSKVSDSSEIPSNVPSANLDSSFAQFTTNLSDDNTIFVNASYSGTSELGTRINPYKSITTTVLSKLTTAKNNLFIANGNYTVSGLTISKTYAINFIGESLNAIISGKGTSQLFYVSGTGLLSIFNLTLTEGFVNGVGADGGILEISNKSKVNIVNSVLKDSYSYTNSSGYYAAGGAIFNDKGTLKIYNCTFFNNYAKTTQGNESYGGAIYNYWGDVTILNSQFINNSAVGLSSAGGAIYSFVGNLIISNTTFVNNSVNATNSLGGAVCTWQTIDTYVLNSIFDSNILHGTSTYGAAIANNAVLFEFINNTVINNVAEGTAFENSTVLNLVGNFYYINNVEENNTIKNAKKDILSCLEDQMSVENPFSADDLANLPSSYDLRDYGLLTSVKNQGDVGSCWAFATIAAMESYLLKYENASYDFSENNLQNSMNEYGANSTDWAQGGNHIMSVAYLVRWSGPINESDDPFVALITYPKTGLTTVKHVQDVLYVPLRFNFTDNDQIKAALMKYGALYVSINASDMSYNQNYYYDMSTSANHAITLVGWDDSYSASKFSNTPPGDGAFIIKNSWGSSYGDNGYYYISYYDKTFAGYGLDSASVVAFTNIENVTNYKDIYQYDPIGNTFESLGYGCSTAWFANQFTATSNNPLSAIGLYTFGNSSYTINIYVNSILKYTQKSTQNSMIVGNGYHTIKLNKKVSLKKGDVFRIVVKLTTPCSLFPIAIESKHASYSSKATASTGQSYVSPDGNVWYDIAQNTNLIKFMDGPLNHTLTKTNVCLKAYTAYASNLVLNLSSNVSLFRPGDSIELVINLTNYGDLAKEINISSIIGDGANIESFNLTKGSFVDSIWSIDSLNTDESAVLCLVLLIRTDTEVISNTFKINCSTYNLNENTSLIYNLYYSGTTHFLNSGNTTTYTFSGDKVSFALVDALNRPIADKPVAVSIYDGENNLLTILNFITGEDGYIDLVLSLSEGNYSYFLSFAGDDDYNASNLTINVESIKRNTSFAGDYLNNVLSILSRSGDVFTITLLDDSSNPIADRHITLINNKSGDVYDLITDEDGISSFILDLTKDYYGFVLYFAGDDLYKSTEAFFNVNVTKRAAPYMILGDTSIYSVDNFTVVFVDEDMNVLVNSTVTFNLLDSKGKFNSYSVVTDGNGVATISYLAAGDYIASISLRNDDRYEDVNQITTLKVSKSPSSIAILESGEDANILIHNGENITIVLLDVNNNTIPNRAIEISITDDEGNENIYNLDSDDEGIVKLALAKGEYVIAITLDEDEYISNSNYSASVNVIGNIIDVNHTGDDLRDIQIAIDNANPGDYINLGDNYNYLDLDNINITKDLTIFGGENITLSSAADAACIFNVVSISENGPNEVVISNISFNAKENDVIVQANAEDGGYYSSIAAIDINNIIVKADNDVNTNSITILKVFTDSKNFNPLNSIKITGNTFVSGMKPFRLLNTNWGDGSGDIVIPAAEAVETIITVDSISNYQGTITAILKDLNNNVLSGKTINYTVNGIKYSTTTDENGRIKISGLAGESVVVISYDGDESYSASSSTVSFTAIEAIGTVIECTNMTTTAIATARTGEYFTFALKDVNGKALANQTVQIGFNGVTYTRTTDENGSARLQVNLKVAGGYTFAIAFLGTDEYNSSFTVAKITVKARS